MIWVFIDNTGTILCNVSVGNRVRQGNPFSMFVCFAGGANSANGYEDNAMYGVQNVSYIRPDLSYLQSAYVSLTGKKTRQTFYLGTPSQMNSCFVNGVTYEGYLVEFSQEATTFNGNGGHMAVLISMFSEADPDDRELDQYAQMLSLFIEPVYGQKPNTLTLGDYDLLMRLWRNSANVSLGVLESEDALDELHYVSPTEDNPNPDQPNAFYTYVYDGVPYFLFVSYDEATGVTTQQRIGFEDGKLVSATRTYSSDGWTEWEAEYANPITNIKQTRTANQYGLVTNTITFTMVDGKTYSFDFLDGVGIRDISTQESQDSGAYNTITISLTNRDVKTFRVRNGEKGEPALGNIGVTMVVVTEDNYQSLGFTAQNAPFGHLLMYYSNIEDEPSGYYLVSESNLAQLEQYGVTESMIGHLVHVAE